MQSLSLCCCCLGRSTKISSKHFVGLICKCFSAYLPTTWVWFIRDTALHGVILVCGFIILWSMCEDKISLQTLDGLRNFVPSNHISILILRYEINLVHTFSYKQITKVIKGIWKPWIGQFFQRPYGSGRKIILLRSSCQAGMLSKLMRNTMEITWTSVSLSIPVEVMAFTSLWAI